MQRKLLYGFAAGLVSAVVALVLWRTDVLDRLEFATWNWRVNAMARPSPETGRIKLILLDQASLDWARREQSWSWPWPREAYTTLIAFCRRGGAKAVAFDVLFTEPSVYGVSDDESLGNSIGERPDVVQSVFVGDKSGDFEDWPEYLPGIAPWDAPERVRRHLSGPRAAFPIPEIATNAVLLANVSDDPERDGVFRRASLVRVFAGRPLMSLGLSAYLAGLPPGERGVPRVEGRTLRIAGRAVPTDWTGRAILRFRGRSQTHETFSAGEIVQSEMRLREGIAPNVSASVFTNAYVFFGFSAPGLMDLRPTPVSRVYPGVEIHATALDNFLAGDFMREPRPRVVALGVLLLAIAAALAGVMSRAAWQTVAALCVFLPLPLAAGFASYSAGYWWPVVVGGLAVLLAMVSAVVINYATEGRQKAFIKQAFKHYLSPEVIEKIIKDPKHLKLGGERRELTIFFSDLQGFSSFSEKLDPPALTALLNDYLSDMTDIILEEGGTLDKYEGDAIIAFWNAPVAQADHAARACRAALRCQRKLAERRAEFRQKTGVDLHMRIGMHTGEVVVGNMGSAARFNYTVLGDAANLASRLEGANKAFGTFLMVSEVTWKAAGGTISGRELARLRVVGRAAPVRVYELTGFQGEAVADAARQFEAALQVLFAGRLKEAAEAFEAIAGDAPAQRYAARCRDMLARGEGTWDGTWNLTEK